MKYLTHLMPALALGVVIPAVPAQAQQMNNCPLSERPHTASISKSSAVAG